MCWCRWVGSASLRHCFPPPPVQAWLATGPSPSALIPLIAPERLPSPPSPPSLPPSLSPQATAQFYRHESQEYLAQNTCPDYLKKAEQRLGEERLRVAHYLDNSTEPRLKEIVETELIKVRKREGEGGEEK